MNLQKNFQNNKKYVEKLAKHATRSESLFSNIFFFFCNYIYCLYQFLLTVDREIEFYFLTPIHSNYQLPGATNVIQSRNYWESINESDAKASQVQSFATTFANILWHVEEVSLREDLYRFNTAWLILTQTDIDTSMTKVI